MAAHHQIAGRDATEAPGAIVLTDDALTSPGSTNADLARRLAELESECHRLHELLVAAQDRSRDAESRVAQLLLRSEQRFAVAMQHAPIGMALVGLDGTFLDTNPALCHIVRYSREELLALTFQDITHPEDLATDLELVGRLVAGELPSYRMDKRYIRKDGTTVWVELQVSLVRSGDGSPEHFVSQIVDIEDRRAEHASLHFQAHHDPLTGLANRTALLSTLSRISERPEGAHSAVLYCDLDEFTSINTVYGHAGGDVVLREVAERVRNAVRQGDTVARIGGDEFVIVLDGVTTLEAAQAVAEKIREAVAAPVSIEDREELITISSGIALVTSGAAPEAMLDAADTALYRAKREGRDRVATAG